MENFERFPEFGDYVSIVADPLKEEFGCEVCELFCNI